MFKNCAPFTKCISNEHIGSAHNLDIIMPMHKLIEYSDNYWDASGNLWQFKRDEQNLNNRNPVNVTTTDSWSFKYKLSLIGESTAANNNRVFKNIKIKDIWVIFGDL